MDVWDPALITSYDNFCLYLVIIDEYTRFSCLFSSARKVDVAYTRYNFITLMHNQISNYLKEIQSDGGSEFGNHQLIKFFQNHEIFHKMSCLETPEQNGLVERRHRHIVETGMTLMAHSSVPTKF